MVQENKNIKTFIFDCFGVILDPVLSGWYKENRLKKGLVDKNIEKTIHKYDLGDLSEDEMVEYFLKYDGENLTKEKLRKEIDSYLNLDKKIAGIILKLKNNGFKTVLLSNSNRAFFERMVYKEYPGFKNLFDHIIISSEIKLTKPDPEIYLYALQKSDSKPEESLFIDDTKINVDGAIDLNINGYLYTDPDSFKEYLKTIGIDF